MRDSTHRWLTDNNNDNDDNDKHDDGYDLELELWHGVSVPVPAWLLTPSVMFTAGVVCGLLLALAAFTAGLYLAYT